MYDESNHANERGLCLGRIERTLADLNAQICQAVEAGLSVELVRSRRHHGGAGNWGDIMKTLVVKSSAPPIR
jgi:hypothetical protein